MRPCERAVTSRVGRIEFDAAPEENPGRLVFDGVAFGHMPHTALICRPRVHVGRQLAYRAALLRTNDRRRHGNGGGSCYLVLNSKGIYQVSLKALAPQKRSRRRFGEPAGSANSPFGAAHATLQDVADVGLVASLTDVNRSIVGGRT